MLAAPALFLHKGQKIVMQDRHRFRVIVAGRRWGKCIADDTLISKADGSEVKVQDVAAGDWLLTLNEDTYKMEPRQVLHLIDNGVKETVVVQTSGRKLQVTPNHPILANNKWINAGDLKVGDLVAVPKRLAFGSETMPDHELVLLALWLAEGADYRICNQTPEIVRELFSAAAALGIVPRAKNGLDWYLGNGNRAGGPQAGSKNPLRQLLERHNIWGLNSKSKVIPDALFRLNEAQLSRFLNLFIACDGSISKRSGSTWSLEIGLANEMMVRQIGKLLHKFGIRGQIRHKVHKAVSSRTGLPFESWTFVASTPDVIMSFADRIGALSKNSAVSTARIASLLSRGNCNSYLPISHDAFAEHLVYDKVEHGKYGGYNASVARGLPDALRQGLTSWRKQNTDRVSTRRYAALRDYSNGHFDPIADGDLAWEEVIAVTSASAVQTWDLALPDNHNFVAEGIVTHNTQISKVALIKAACERRNQLAWYVAPTYQMARGIMWDDLKVSIPRVFVRKINETRMTIHLVNGSRIELKGADKPDSLRGVGLNFLVMDEAQDIKEETWSLVLRPTLSTTGGKVIFIGTPKSFNWLYDLYQAGQRGETFLDEKGRSVKNLWRSWQFPTIASPFIPPSEVRQARRDLDPKSFRQEWEASFETMAGRVYYSFDRHRHIGDYAFNPQLPIKIGQDFNIDPMSSVIIQEQSNGEIWVVDEAVLYGSNTQETADEISRRYWKQINRITFYPDPAGNNRNHDRGESSLEILRQSGFNRILFKRKHPAVADRVNAVNRLLMTADGTVRLKIDRRCKHVIEALEQTIYKAGTRDVDKKAGVEHPADAFGYYAEYEHPVIERKIGGASI